MVNGRIDAGWRTIAEGLFYGVAGMRARLHDAGQREDNLDYSLSFLAMLSASSFCVGNVVDHDYLTRCLRIVLDPENVFLTEKFRSGRSLEPFIAHLSGLNFSGSGYGVYDKVLSSWGDLSGFERAIIECCDYHCGRLTDVDRKVLVEFTTMPFHLIPFEIEFILRMRERAGLGRPVIHHPLMQGPFGIIPDKLSFEPNEETELLREAVYGLSFP
jgi:hypothetical protein